VVAQKQNLPFFIDKKWQYLPPVFSMNSEDLSHRFWPAKNVTAPDTIIGSLKEKLRD
jgi:hypothetical protein